MQNESSSNNLDRVVVKQRCKECCGVERVSLSRYAIGMVLNGEKYIQQNDQTVRVHKGEIFFMGYGNHFVEDIPAANAPYEQITIFYTPSQLQIATSALDSDMLKQIYKSTSAIETKYDNVAVSKPSKILHNFFVGVNAHYESRGFIDDPISEQMKFSELVHYIIKYDSGEILRLMMAGLDCNRVHFERLIYNNIFTNKSIEELAKESNRSVSTFKNDFNIHFSMSPHRWIMRQRLNYAQMLLSTTSNSVAQISEICAFPNASHFIKIFKRQFGATPISYKAELELNKKNIKREQPSGVELTL